MPAWTMTLPKNSRHMATAALTPLRATAKETAEAEKLNVDGRAPSIDHPLAPLAKPRVSFRAWLVMPGATSWMRARCTLYSRVAGRLPRPDARAFVSALRVSAECRSNSKAGGPAMLAMSARESGA